MIRFIHLCTLPPPSSQDEFRRKYDPSIGEREEKKLAAEMAKEAVKVQKIEVLSKSYKKKLVDLAFDHSAVVNL